MVFKVSWSKTFHWRTIEAGYFNLSFSGSGPQPAGPSGEHVPADLPLFSQWRGSSSSWPEDTPSPLTGPAHPHSRLHHEAQDTAQADQWRFTVQCSPCPCTSLTAQHCSTVIEKWMKKICEKKYWQTIEGCFKQKEPVFPHLDRKYEQIDNLPQNTVI